MAHAGILQGITGGSSPWVRRSKPTGPIDLTDGSPDGDAMSSSNSSGTSRTSLTIQHIMPTVNTQQKAVDTIAEQISTTKELMAITDDDEEREVLKQNLKVLLKRKLDSLEGIYITVAPVAPARREETPNICGWPIDSAIPLQPIAQRDGPTSTEEPTIVVDPSANNY